MAMKSLGFTIGARDAAGAVFTKVAGAVDKATDSVRRLDRAKAAPRLDVDDTRLHTKLGKAAQELQDLDLQRPKPEIDAEITQVQAKIARVRERLDELSRQDASPEVEAETTAALAELDQLQAHLAHLNGQRAVAHVDADTAAATTGLAVVDAQASRLDGRQVDVGVEVDRGGSLLAAAGGAARLAAASTAAAAAVAGIGAAVPAVGALAGALASAAGAAGLIPAALAGGGAIFGAVKLGLGGISDAYTAVTQADAAGAGSAAGNAAARVAAARQVESAQRSVAAAIRAADRQAIQSGWALADARDAVSRAQQSAAQAVSDSRLALSRAEASAAEQSAAAQEALDQAVIASAERVRSARERVTEVQASAARRVESAELALGRAQRTSREAQEDLNEARRDAVEDLEDLQASLAGTALDERGAVIALERARERLAKMPRNASALDWTEAELEVDRAEQALAEVRTRYRELQEESAAAAQAGVEGSEQVQAAKQNLLDSQRAEAEAEAELRLARIDGAKEIAAAERARDQTIAESARQVNAAREALRRADLQGDQRIGDARAQLRRAELDGDQSVAAAREQLRRAQQQADWQALDSSLALADAQRQLDEALTDAGAAGAAAAGGINAADAALAKLSPNARALVTTLAKLKPAWDAVKWDVQDRMLAGVAKRVESLAGRYLPLLNLVLGDVADSLNGAFHDVSDLLETEQATDKIQLGFSRVSKAIDIAADASAPLLNIFLDLFEVGSEFLPEIAQEFKAGAEQAAGFVAEARQTGRLREWIAGGIESAKQFGTVFFNAGSIVRTVLKAADDQGVGLLDTLVLLTGETREFLKSVQGQAALLAFFTALDDTVDSVLPGLRSIADAIAQGVIILAPVLPDIGDGFSRVATAVAPLIPELAELGAAVLPTLAAVMGGPTVWALELFLGAVRALGGGGSIPTLVAHAVALYAAIRVFSTVGQFGMLLSFAGTVTSLVPQLSGLSSRLTTIGSVMRGVAVGGGILAAAGTALSLVWDALTVSSDEVRQAISQVGSAASAEAYRALVSQTATLDAFRRFGGTLGEGFATVAGLFTTTTDEMRASLHGVELAQLNAADALNRYNVAVERFGGDSEQAQAAQRVYADAVDEVERAQRDAEQATKSHTDRLKEQTDQMAAAASADIGLRQSLIDVTEAQEAAAQAAREYGSGSREAEQAQLRLEQAVLRSADAAAKKAEEDAKANGVTDTAGIRTAAYTQSLLSQAATLNGPARESMLGYIAGLDQSTLSAISAQNQMSGLATRVLTLPDGRTITVLADPTQALGTLDATVQAISGAVATFTADANAAPAAGKIQGTLDFGNGSTAVVTLDANPNPADGKIHGTVDMGNGQLATITVDANQTPSDGKIKATVDYGNGSTSVIDVDANNFAAWQRTNEVVDHGNRQRPTMQVDADVSPAKSWIDWIRDIAGAPVRFFVSAFGGNAVGAYYPMARGGLLPMADGGNLAPRRPRPMSATRAAIVPPNTPRLIGDRASGDEAFIPINNSARSEAILGLAANRMGYALSPLKTAGQSSHMTQLAGSPAAMAAQRGAPPVIQLNQQEVVAAIHAMSRELAGRIEHARQVTYAPTIIGSRQDRTADALALDARTAADQGIFG